MDKDWLKLRREILEVVHDHQSLLDRMEMELLRSSGPVSHSKLANVLVDIYNLDTKLMEYLKLLTPIDQFITQLEEKYKVQDKEVSKEAYRNSLLSGLIKLLKKD